MDFKLENFFLSFALYLRNFGMMLSWPPPASEPQL